MAGGNFPNAYLSAAACGPCRHGSQSRFAVEAIVPTTRASQEREAIGSPIAADKRSKTKAQIEQFGFLSLAALLTRSTDIKLNQQA
jgi:hypothetical protein